MATKTKAVANDPSGAPRWTHVVGALVGVVTAAWLIVSHFIPKPDPVPTPSAAASAAPTMGAPSVSVSGSGNVGVGNNSGTVNVGAAPPPHLRESTRR